MFNNLFNQYRRSQRRCSIKKMFLKISRNSQENTCAGVTFWWVASLRHQRAIRSLKTKYQTKVIQKMSDVIDRNKSLLQISIPNRLSVNPRKWSDSLKQFVGNSRRNCLSMFDHFVGLVLKGLKTWRCWGPHRCI